jgi:pyruvate formate lyase activating enzyme
MKKEAMLYKKGEDKFVQCYLCAHQCKIANLRFGVCGVRQNIEGTLYSLVYAQAVAAHTDPIEKKPLYHFLPGSTSYSIATVGCNFKCGFCQNWQISQISKTDAGISAGYELMPAEVVDQAKKNGCMSISYTYTEPNIFFEYALDTAKLAKKADLYNIFITNGYMTKEALYTISPYLDAANVDLKSFRDEYYQKNCKAHLQPVLDSIVCMKELNIWVEVTTLVIPGENDSPGELGQIAQFIAQLSKDIPWHLSRFHPEYQFTESPPTPLDTLRKAQEIGKGQGLRYVYLGNIGKGIDTNCYNCNKLVVKRSHFSVEKSNVEKGKCSSCGAEIAGVWR